MTRSVSATISTAVDQPVTKPVYLIRMGWAVEERAATWDVNILWDAETWEASGISVSNLDSDGGTMRLPLGDDDPWLDLIVAEGQLNIAVEIYEHQTNYTVSPNESDAVLIFSGIMDECSIRNDIKIKLIEDKKHKAFPPTSIEPGTYNYLLQSGTVLIWRDTIITVE